MNAPNTPPDELADTKPDELAKAKSDELDALRAELAATKTKAEKLHDVEAELAALKANAEELDRAIAQKAKADEKTRADELAATLAAAARANELAASMPFITRELLVTARACGAGMRTFEKRCAELQTDGFRWSEAEVQRLHAINPRFLRWYEYHGLVPMLEADGVPSVADRKEELHARYQRNKRRQAQLVAQLSST